MKRMIQLLSSAIVFIANSSAMTDEPPKLQREFRAAWVATVANIDWPSKPGLSTAAQQRELIAIYDRCVALNLNAVILQVRPMCDALYASKLEPWSEFLTGTMGKAPEPYYDPLEFAVTEAHKRGLELHTWLNPYRAHSPAAKSKIADSHIVKRTPELAPKYGKHYWMIPTEPAVQKQSLDVFLDIVKRYDIDGMHMDDYFYPYSEKDETGQTIPFPDDASWKRYQDSGGKLTRDDWRRDAVNQFVQNLYVETKKIKPWVKVGISPFGIWRPGHPEGIKGFDQYAGLYADAKLWLNEGWVDYFTPQLYWELARTDQSYPKLLAWWAGENTKHRHLWPGNNAGRAVSGGRGRKELLAQIDITRKQNGAGGNVFFSMKSLQRNKEVEAALKEAYAQPALIPASDWLRPKQHGRGGHATIHADEGKPKSVAIKFDADSKSSWLLLQQSPRINGDKSAKAKAPWKSKLLFVEGLPEITIAVSEFSDIDRVACWFFDRFNAELGGAIFDLSHRKEP